MSVDLRVDWCDHKAAEYAVMNWHYSKTMPTSKLVKIGAWENNRFIGAIVFSYGSNKAIGQSYGLTMQECCELVRVALGKHESHTSAVVAKAISLLKKQSPGLRLILSLADQTEGHIGTLYQAGNWIYAGYSTGDPRVRKYIDRSGRTLHWRTVGPMLNSRGLTESVESARAFGLIPQEHLPKHKYLYPLDRAMRKQITPLAKPYPKRATCEQSVEGDTVGDQSTEEGSIPSVRSDSTSIEPVLIDE